MPYTIEDPRPDKILFKNVHGNYFETFQGIVRLHNADNEDTLEEYNTTTISIQKLIKEAIAKQVKFRACGSLWSLSKAPYVDGYAIFNKRKINDKDTQSMLYKRFLKKADLSTKSKTKEYLFCQSGNTIKALNNHCVINLRSLQTSGASNGQTIAGAICTGVHGSSIHVGSIQDTVVGLHIITGPDKKDSIFLEAKSEPIVNSNFVKSIGARLVQDDDQFHAALVGIGAFGYTHGVVIRTETKFILKNYIRQIGIDKVYEFIDAFNTSVKDKITIKDVGLNQDGELWTNLFHMKFYVNQYRLHKTIAEIIYKHSPEPDVRGIPEFLKYNKDFVFGVGKAISGVLRFLIPGQISKQFPKDGSFEKGVLGELFWDTPNMRDGQFACAAAFPISVAKRALEILLSEAHDHRMFPATYSLRFVKKSKATLAFTKYDMNCIFGIDGMDTKETRRFLKGITIKLQEEQIEHTWHWGKANHVTRKFATNAYGTELKSWQEARKKLIPNSAIAIFESTYLKERGLV